MNKQAKIQESEYQKRSVENYYNLKLLINALTGYYYCDKQRMISYIKDKIEYVRSYDSNFNLKIELENELSNIQGMATKKERQLHKNLKQQGGWILSTATFGGLLLLFTCFMTTAKKYITYGFEFDYFSINLSLFIFLIGFSMILYAIIRLTQRSFYQKRQKVFSEVADALRHEICMLDKHINKDFQSGDRRKTQEKDVFFLQKGIDSKIATEAQSVQKNNNILQTDELLILLQELKNSIQTIKLSDRIVSKLKELPSEWSRDFSFSLVNITRFVAFLVKNEWMVIEGIEQKNIAKFITDNFLIQGDSINGRSCYVTLNNSFAASSSELSKKLPQVMFDLCKQFI